MRHVTCLALAALISAAGLMTAACSDDSSPITPTPTTTRPTARTLQSVRIETPEDLETTRLTVGQTVQLTACAAYSDQTDDCAVGDAGTWTSSEPGIATINTSGLVTGVASGTTTITFSFEARQTTLTLTVNAAAPHAVALEIDGPDSLQANETVHFRAHLRLSDGSRRENVSAVWTSSNTTVATVDDAGRVTGQQPGQFDLRSTAEEVTGRRIGITVTEPRQLEGIDWRCDRREAQKGERVLCHATAHYSTAPREMNITAELTGNTVRASNRNVLRPDEYRDDLNGQPFVVDAVGAGEAATWVVYQNAESSRWSVRVTDPTTTRWRGIRVAPEAGRSGYQRPSWNVADTEIHRRDGSPACTAYTQTPITNVGPGDGLDREHIVALAEAWDSRPSGFSQSALRRIAEDHDNLTLATASVNRSKSDRDAAEWRPEHNGAWMAHRIVEVKRKYDLSVNPAERDWLERLLGSGPDRITCGSTPPTAHHPPIREYRNCTALREAGWNRGVNRNGGTYRTEWDDAERQTYELNTTRDRDKDGHACE